MNTDDLILLLANDAGPVDRHEVSRKYALAIAFGTPISMLMMVSFLGFRPDLMTAIWLPMFWVKLAFASGMMWGSLLMTLRLSRPEGNLGHTPLAIAAVVVGIWLFAGFQLLTAPADTDIYLILGSTWQKCPFLIMVLALPFTVAATLAMRELAPTHLPQAGMAVGLLSGSAGAVVYCLHCPEMEAPFLATWYLLGILIPGIIGLVFGQRLLRW